jgi:hypothetical protein
MASCISALNRAVTIHNQRGAMELLPKIEPESPKPPMTGEEIRECIRSLNADMQLALDVIEACMAIKTVSRVLPGPLEATMLHLLKQYRQRQQPELILP